MNKRALMISVLLFIITITSTIVASADEQMPRSDTHFQGYGITMGTTDDGRLHVTIEVDAKETSATLGCTNFDIQQKISGIWMTVSDNNFGRLKYDTATCIFSRNFGGVVIGEQYRIIATFYCQKYDGTERVATMTSHAYTLGR